MSSFDENKHPRDNDGKFTSKTGGKSYRQNTSYSEILADGKKDVKQNTVSKKNKSSLTSQEWAMWYKAVAENKKLGYWAEQISTGDAILKIENNGSHKIVITGGTFEDPKAKAVYSFDSVDKMNDAIERLKLLW